MTGRPMVDAGGSRWLQKAHALANRPRNGGDCSLDLFGDVIAAEAEANPLPAHVGNDVGPREPIMECLRSRQFEGEEMAAPGTGLNRRD
jgi:hypothetical protein